MDKENRLVLMIGALLLVIIALPFFFWRYHETHRPLLHDARVVIATGSDTVFRDGTHRLGPDEEARLAVALLVEKPGQGTHWLAPVGELHLDGERVDHIPAVVWPEDDRMVRVFWFTVENAFVGGKITPENAAKRLRYRKFFAPELGNEMTANGPFEAHNDDSLGPTKARFSSAGTLRFYARVEVISRPTETQAQQSASTIDLDRLHDVAFPAIHRSAALPTPLRPQAGELFLLPGLEPTTVPPEDWNTVTAAAFGRPFTELVRSRLVCSSRTLAAVAVSDSPLQKRRDFEDQGGVRVEGDRFVRNGQPLKWGEHVLAADLLVSGSHWVVLTTDDGSGELDAQDPVLHSWRRPAEVVALGELFGDKSSEIAHLRFRGGS